MITYVKKRFRSRLKPRGPGGAWTFLRIPFDVNKAFGSKGRVSVAGRINGSGFRSSLFAEGDGTHILWVNKVLQERARVSPGDSVQVSLARDLAKRVVAIPAPLKRALVHSGKARAAFLKLTYSRKREIVDRIRQAKTGPTQERRIGQVLKGLSGGVRRGV